MNIDIIFKIVVFVSWIYSFINYLRIRKYIQKLPKMTKEKYVGLQSFGIRMLLISAITFVGSLFISNKIIVIMMSCATMYILMILISELSVLKEYVNLKKKMR